MPKLTGRTELAETPANGDLLHIVDVSDPTDNPAGTSKKITRQNLVGGLSPTGHTHVHTHELADGATDVTASAAELNLLDGVTASTAELNHIDGVTSPIQTQLDDKQAGGDTLDSLEGLSLVAGDMLYATAADTLIRLPKGTANQELRMNAGATAPEWYTPAASGGQTTYDAIVAPSGGDYTTLGAAIAAASSGWSIFIKEGTFVEGAINTALNNLTIVAENPATSILSIGTNWLIFSGTNVNVRNFGVIGSTGYMFLSGNEARADNIRLNFSGVAASTATLNVSGVQSIVTNCHVINTTTTGTPGTSTMRLTGNSSVMKGCYVYGPVRTASAGGSLLSNNGGLNTRIIGNTFEAGSTVVGAIGVYQGGTHATITGNTFVGFDLNGVSIALSIQVGCVVAGNVIRGGRAEIASSSTFTGNRFVTGAGTSYSVLTITAVNGLCATNEFIGSSAAGTTAISVNSGSDRYSVIGNQIQSFITGISVGAAAVDNTQIFGNHFFSCTTTISDSGTGTDISGNYGVPAILEKRHFLMKNTSGATVNAGNVVTFKSVAAGDEVTTSTTAGDTKVYGVATTAITNTASGYIQVLGKTTALTVNGTTDIAVGDFLSCYTAAGIAQKAVAGQMAFAIALEAYTTDDSAGVIDALIISPRLI